MKNIFKVFYLALFFLSQAKAEEVSRSYADVLSEVTNRIDSYEKLIKKSGDSDWLLRDKLTSAYIERASLTNKFSDFSAAENVLNQAFKNAPQGSGPLLTAARLDYSLHRLSDAEKKLDLISKQVLIKSDKQIAILALQSNILFQRGNYSEALKGYHQCENYQSGACLEDLAIYYSKTGGLAEARSIFNLLLLKCKNEDFHHRAWLNLQLGIIELNQKNYDMALINLNAANKIMPDWWLVQEHIAETLGLKGDYKAAIEIYEKIVEQTGLPQYIDALAEMNLKVGKNQESEKLFKQAELIWQTDIKNFPEAVSGHAIDHYSLVNNKEEFYKLALSNYKNRPNGEAGIKLAKALLEIGEQKQAKLEIEKILKSTYESKELNQVACLTGLNQFCN